MFPSVLGNVPEENSSKSNKCADNDGRPGLASLILRLHEGELSKSRRRHCRQAES